MTAPAKTHAAPLRYWRLAALICYWGLIMQFGAAVLVTYGGLPLAGLLIWLFQALPLLAFFPGLRADHVRSYLWLSAIVLLYFIHGILEAFNPTRMWFGLLEAVLCSGLFVSLALSIRLFHRQEHREG